MRNTPKRNECVTMVAEWLQNLLNNCVYEVRCKNKSWQHFLLVTKNFLVKVQLSNAAIFSWRLTTRILEEGENSPSLEGKDIVHIIPFRSDILFVAVEIIDGRLELDWFDHFPRPERIQVNATVGRARPETRTTNVVRPQVTKDTTLGQDTDTAFTINMSIHLVQ